MKIYSTDEKNTLVVISLLKAHDIRYVVASPGSTNSAFVGSIQKDPYFEVFSSVDERSAAYIACGLAAETDKPVVISCTGATASRNYLPGMTEAYYRKLPILAITSTQPVARIGHHVAQVTDRSSIQNDVAKLSVTLPIVKDDEDLWECEVKVNRAILELKRHGGGPVHINLPTTYSPNFSEKELPNFRVIHRICHGDKFPALADKGRVAVFIGSHKNWTVEETNSLEQFCEVHNAVVFCDHTSGYKGKHHLLFSLAAAQEMISRATLQPDVTIHIGEITGDYPSLGMLGGQVWRVSDDGEIRDTVRKLRYVFEMSEKAFFQHYLSIAPTTQTCGEYYVECKTLLEGIRKKIPKVPFSNVWLASKLAHKIPAGSAVHFGILNSLRVWNFYQLPESVTSFSNVGGFGIDGNLSSLLGASLANQNKLFFGVIGDLAFFYDMNAVGNRHVGNNLRILVINNGKGTEFRLYNHRDSHFGEVADEYIAAAGHYGNKSPVLIKNYAENLGFEYLTASNKEEFESVYQRFLISEVTNKPMLFEVFTDSDKESEAIELMHGIEVSAKGKAKKLTRSIIGPKGVSVIKKVIKR